MNNELFEALAVLEREKNISRDAILEAIRQSLQQAVKNQYGGSDADNVVVNVDEQTGEYEIYAMKTVSEDVEDSLSQISLVDARMIDPSYQIGDQLRVEIHSKEFGRIVTQNAKNVILQKIREEERKSLFNQYHDKVHQVVNGVVQRYVGNNVSVSLGKVEAMLNEKDMIHVRKKNVPGQGEAEKFYPNQRIRVYVSEVKDTSRGPRIMLSRVHPDMVRRLFENEVAEVRDGTVEIKAIAREAGNRTKIAVYSNDPDVDPVGACVGLNGARVNAVVEQLGGEKIDIINWDPNPGLLIENAISPAQVILVMCDLDENTAKVVVPDEQLSLAIGKEGQNARLAARLTNFKIDIESEKQARENGDLQEHDYYGEEEDFEEEEFEAEDELMAEDLEEEEVLIAEDEAEAEQPETEAEAVSEQE